MERNIAALMREDAFTVHVSFAEAGGEQAQKTYTYIGWMPLAEGDKVVVNAAGLQKVARVTAVDNCVKIEPGASILYSWVVAKVDVDAYLGCQARNAEIEELVRNAYQNNLRRSFAQQVLSGLDGDAAARVQALLAPAKGA